jgi:23S rRNA pseudouridine2457 synthase
MPLLLLNKPYQVLSQFRDSEGRATLADIVDVAGVYPAGRLDYDSEGLLVLTDDGRLQARISEPAAKTPKTYWAQVEGEPTDEQLTALRDGVLLKDGPAAAVFAKRIDEPEGLWTRQPPIRVRKTVPDHWLELQLEQGRNRQVRRMTAAVGLPTLRLIRAAVGPWRLGGLKPGDVRVIGNQDAWKMLDRR